MEPAGPSAATTPPGTAARDAPGMGALGVVTAVALAGAVVAVASAGVQLVVPAVELSGAGAWVVRAFGAALVAAGIAVLLRQRARLLPARGRGPDPSGAALRTAAGLMGLLALVALLANPVRAPARPDASAPTRFSLPVPDESEAGGEAGPRRAPPGRANAAGAGMRSGGGSATSSGEAVLVEVADEQEARSLLGLVARYLPIAILIAAMTLAYMIATGRLKRDGASFVFTVPLDPVDAQAGLEASLDEILRATSGDARDPITAAYRRLLRALDEAGAPRLPHEAPHEHLYRALAPLGVPPEPLHRLTELYVAAQFGGRRMSEAERASASRALRESLDGLREARAVRPGGTASGAAS